MIRFRRTLLPLLLLLSGLALVTYMLWTSSTTPGGTLASSTLRPAQASTALATVTPVPTPAPTVAPQAFSVSYAQRFGVTGFDVDIAAAYDLGLPFTRYADWHVRADPLRPDGVTYLQMIRLREGRVQTPMDTIEAALEANPGAMWLIGNEPDVVVQDNTTAQRYAELYHELYTMIKGRDPTAIVAIGGVSQPTPLRRAYLDIVLDHYQTTYGQPMPVDVWNVHAFILREEEGQWGIGIPPGMDDDLAILYEIEDHNDLDTFARNLIDFREWMARRGYGDRPLLVSEFGFLMPHDFGFTEQDAATFLQGSFEFLLTARDETGFAPDGGRLVQWWLWFIVSAPDDEFETSFLFDRPSDQLTGLGQAYIDFVQGNTPAGNP